METVKSILCPVDLSDNSQAAIQMASSLARQFDARLYFLFVAPPPLPQENMLGSDYATTLMADEKQQLGELQPAVADVPFEHVFACGNPGPEIVRHAADHDLLVMSTHGHTGLTRLLMGSVAEYVVRHASCPVLTVKVPEIKRGSDEHSAQFEQFVTESMNQVNPVQVTDEIAKVVAELDLARETAAPVIDDAGQTIGILTRTDIDKYHHLLDRYEKHDASVIPEMFQTDEFGQRRVDNLDFDQVRRHMTSPAITISNRETLDQARELLQRNPSIHHLVVVDENDFPVGILNAEAVF